MEVLAVPAYNVDKFRAPGQPYHPRESGGVGYVVALDGVRYYHAGDTDAVPEMADVHCDVALLPGGRQVHDDVGGGGRGVRADRRRRRPSRCTTARSSGTIDDAERFRDHCRVPVTILPLER